MVDFHVLYPEVRPEPESELDIQSDMEIELAQLRLMIEEMKQALNELVESIEIPDPTRQRVVALLGWTTINEVDSEF